MAPHNSRNCQAMKGSMLAAFPGMTVYTFPDSAHQEGRSDHNWDDGDLLTEQSDNDYDQEIRATDNMLGSHFTKEQAYAVVALLITVNKDRVYYVIFDGYIWHSKRGFRKEVFSGADKHNDHIHCSTLADEDNNADPWIVTKQEVSNVLEGNDLKRQIATNTRLEHTVAMHEKTPINWDTPDVPNNFEDNVLVQTLNRVEEKLDQLLARPTTVTMTDADRLAIVVAVTENIHEAVTAAFQNVTGSTTFSTEVS